MKEFIFIGLLFLGITFNNLDITEGHRILMICPAPSRSHYILCKGVTDTLVDDGHDVTFISTFASDSKKYRDIPLTELMKNVESQGNNPGFAMGNMSQIEMLQLLGKMQPMIIDLFFGDIKVKNILNDKSEKFDLVIFEYFMNEILVGFGVHYKCPVVALSSVSLMSWLATMTGNPLSIATVPNIFTSYTTHMTFGQRVVNTLIALMQEIVGKLMLQPVQNSLYEKYFPAESKLVPYSELKNHISMVMLNSHPSVGVARPLLPNTIEIGGYHIEDPEPLPEDLQKILDSAKDGVIYFSMGSNLKSSDIDMDTRNSILKTFSAFKETILWKFEKDLPGKPKNVIIKKWMPQSSILAHPNVKLFISHGGLLSCTEATYFGVPLLAIPIYGDQYHNAKTLHERGQGVMLEYNKITESSLTLSIKEVLGNPKYTDNAKKTKEIFHDRPMKPRELLAFYINHIIRTNGAKHLSPPALSRCSQLLLDVAFVILLPISILTLLSIIVCKKMCCRRKNKLGNDEKVKRN